MTLTVITFAMTQMKAVFFILAGFYALDAILGMAILKQAFGENGSVDFEDQEVQAYAPL